MLNLKKWIITKFKPLKIILEKIINFIFFVETGQTAKWNNAINTKNQVSTMDMMSKQQ